MNRKLIIYNKDKSLRLRNIEIEDNEFLRLWKNRNKKSFFYQEEISKKQQLEWFKSYLEREKDYMFIVEEFIDREYQPFGCMGFRLNKDHIDLYNIIRGKSSLHCSMFKAMHVMLNYIIKNFDLIITCDVLKDNSAVSWYKKCGFDFLKDVGYYVMKINKEKIRKIEIWVDEEKQYD